MEFNVSSFYEREDAGKQLNSTALEQDENEQKEWKLSPITAETRRGKVPVFNKKVHHSNMEFKSPLKTINFQTTDPSTSGYESKSSTKNTHQSSSSDPKLSMSADISSIVANSSLNQFDSIFINSLHKSINFSPRLVISNQESDSQQKECEKFEWSVEQLAILKPAHISDEEIAASYQSPIPEVEEKIQEALNEYWTKNVSYIPSPDGPRFVNLTHRDGTVTTIQYGGEAPQSSIASEGTTPSLANLVRRKEAVRAAYATSSPKQRPRNFRNLRQVRNRTCQTELTIPSNLDLDFKKLLGDEFCYQPDQEIDDEEVFNISVSSNFSTRRRLFSTSGQREDESEDVGNSSILSADDNLMNESSSQAFNDSLSPVRRSEDISDDIDDGAENIDNSLATSEATRSHVSQIAINISILNDCMMNSIDEAENECEEEEKIVETLDDQRKRIFSDSHIHANEYEILDRSSSSNATPRHEDLDWTPRRFTGSVNNSIVRGCGSSGTFSSGGTAPRELRRFVFDMSPIHPNHNLPAILRTPIQRCHTSLPRGRLDLNDEEEDEDFEEEK
uniref:Protein aurora borealis n=1 Tax=Caenorhabditis tropicalis TaxID=1561998 RepID=A0A1I7UUR1_9PELO